MKYIVMECHLSYAIVLDEEGHFFKVANRNYQVGQTVTNVIEMQIPPPVSDPCKRKYQNGSLRSLQWQRVW